MRVLLLSNNGKEEGLAKALLAAGVTLVPGEQRYGQFYCEDFDVALIDYPQAWGGFKLEVAKAAFERGKLVCSYPHGAGPLAQLDGIVPPCPYVHVELVPAEGFKDVYRAMGYPTRLETIGWYFCEQQPVGACAADRPGAAPSPRLLFAPAHPFSGTEGRTFVPTWQEANLKVWEQFVELPGRKTVHLYGTWEANGMKPDDRVRVSISNLTPWLALEQIDQADVVIGDPETFSRLAIARGKPTVMFGQDIHPHSDMGDRQVVSWEAWRDIARYPYDASDGTLAEIVDKARQGDVADWRARFIGEQTTPLGVRSLLQTLLDERKSPQNRAQRRKKKARL